MKTLNNEIIVHRNEIFTMDKIIQNKDGSPYIISNRLQNPYFLITISNSRYEQERRYLYNKWLDLSSFPRFTNTQPVDLTSIKDSQNGNIKYNSFEEHENEYTVGSDKLVITGWIKDKFITSYVYDDVFFVEKDGIKDYRYWSPITNKWEKYYCRIITTFLQDVTKNWIEQNYVYSINLVSGLLVRDFLISKCVENEIIIDDEYTNEVLYEKLLEKEVLFDDNFNIERPIMRYDNVSIILIPTKLTVLSDIQGGL